MAGRLNPGTKDIRTKSAALQARAKDHEGCKEPGEARQAGRAVERPAAPKGPEAVRP